jgi:hypothetical protein
LGKVTRHFIGVPGRIVLVPEPALFVFLYEKGLSQLSGLACKILFFKEDENVTLKI